MSAITQSPTDHLRAEVEDCLGVGSHVGTRNHVTDLNLHQISALLSTVTKIPIRLGAYGDALDDRN